MQRVELKKAPKSPMNCVGIGFGSPDCTLQATDPQSIINAFNPFLRVPPYMMPEVATVELFAEGPMSSNAVNANLGATIYLLNQGPNVPVALGGWDVIYETQGLTNGQTESNLCICAIGIHLVPSPMVFTVRGNAFSRANFTTAGAKPFSPDSWSLTNDAGGGNAAGNAWTGSHSPTAKAKLWWGGWQQMGFWSMVRAYNVVWSQGQLITLLNEQFRDTAWSPAQGQLGSSGISQVNVQEFVAQVNTRYIASLATTDDFCAIDVLRIGSIGAAANNQGLFTPNNDLDFVDVTYGGIDIATALRHNTEYRSTNVPYMLKPGVNIGLQLQQQNLNLSNDMRAQFDASQAGGSGLGTGVLPSTTSAAGVVPPKFTECQDFTAGVGSNFQERSVDNNNVTQTVTSTWAEFKGGPWTIATKLKGVEVDDDLAQCIRNHPAIKQALCSSCGGFTSA